MRDWRRLSPPPRGGRVRQSAQRSTTALPASESQREAVARNESISTRNPRGGPAVGAAAAGVTGLCAALAAVDAAGVPELEIALSPDGAGFGARGHF